MNPNLSDYQRLLVVYKANRKMVNWTLLKRPKDWSVFCRECWVVRIGVFGYRKGITRVLKYPLSHG